MDSESFIVGKLLSDSIHLGRQLVGQMEYPKLTVIATHVRYTTDFGGMKLGHRLSCVILVPKVSCIFSWVPISARLSVFLP